MAKKITDAIRRERIQPILDYWVPALGLSDWQITWEIVSELPSSTTPGGQAGAQIATKGPYQTAHIRFARDNIDNCPLKEEVEALIVHELGHCLLRPLLATIERNVGNPSRVYDDTLWEVETLVDSLASIFMGARDDKPATALYSPVQ